MGGTAAGVLTLNEVRTRTKLIKVGATAALGYFVDIYDLLLFSIVRVPSLRSLGVQGEDLLRAGEHLLNMQMTGMLLGGLLGGILLTGADILARSVAAAELPVSIFTSLLGAPFLLFLIVKGRREA